MMRLFKSIVAVGLIVILASSCTSPEPEKTQAQTNSEVKPITVPLEQKTTNEMITATVTYINLEGGFYGLITSAGEKLLASNLAKKFHQDGTVLRFRTKPIEGMASIQQWGKMVELLDVQLVKQGTSSDL